MHNAKKGFTLVELLVTIGLFSIIVAIAAGSFTNALRTQRQVALLISAQSNAGLSLEQVAREIRTGYLFCDNPGNTPSNPLISLPCAAINPATGLPHCTTNAGIWTCDLLDFYNGAGSNVDYSLVNGAIARSENGGTAQPITSGNTRVQYLTFTIFGNGEGDHWNPRITISMGISPSTTDASVADNVLNLQTTISARAIDCTPGPSASC